MQDSTRRYRREQELMLSVLHTIGTKTARQHFLNSSRVEKTSFLSLERNRVCLSTVQFAFSYLALLEQNLYTVQSTVGGRG